MGDTPHCRLKNFPKADWSAKCSISASSCTDSDGLRRQTLASSVSSSVRMVPADFPQKRFKGQVEELRGSVSPMGIELCARGLQAAEEDVPQFVLLGAGHGLE